MRMSPSSRTTSRGTSRPRSASSAVSIARSNSDVMQRSIVRSRSASPSARASSRPRGVNAMATAGSPFTSPRTLYSLSPWRARITDSGIPKVLPERGQRIACRAVDPHLEVEVRAGRVARHPDEPELLARGDRLSRTDVDLGEVCVHRRHAAADLDDDDVAVAAGVPRREAHLSRRGGTHRRPHGADDVDPGMDPVPARAEGPSYEADDRPGEAHGE